MQFQDSKFLPDEWLIELGRIVQSWANFEQVLNLLLGKLAGFDEPFETIPSILITHSSFPQRLDMFAALCESHQSSYPNLAEYKPVLALARNAQARRNKFMHHQIGDVTGNGSATVGVTSARGKLKQNLEHVTLSDLSATSQLIVDAGRAMLKLVLFTKP